MTRHVPIRTCVGCRRQGERTVLLRVVAVRADGEAPGFVVRLDPRRAMPGRGAWLHPDLDCVALAIRRKAFARALRCAGPLDASGIAEAVRALVPDVAGAGPAPGPSQGRATNVRLDRRGGRDQPEAGQNADEHPMSPQR